MIGNLYFVCEISLVSGVLPVIRAVLLLYQDNKYPNIRSGFKLILCKICVPKCVQIAFQNYFTKQWISVIPKEIFIYINFFIFSDLQRINGIQIQTQSAVIVVRVVVHYSHQYFSWKKITNLSNNGFFYHKNFFFNISDNIFSFMRCKVYYLYNRIY